MTRAKAIEILKKLIEAMQGHVTVLPTPERIAAIRLAIASLETDEAYQLEYENPTTKNNLGVDCISRQAVIDSLYDWSNHSMTDAETWHLRQVIGDIKSMPSVTPQEPKTGHWYRQTNDFVDYYECSECGMAIGLYDVKNYCPNCGSRNEVEE